MRPSLRLARLTPSASLLLLAATLVVSCGDDAGKPPPASAGGNVGHGATTGGGDRSQAGDEASGGDGSGNGGANSGDGGAESDAGATSSSGGAPSGVCNDGKGATITGRVLAPNGELPLAGATVYVPSGSVDPLPNGAGCWRCVSALAGSPIALAITDGEGRFEITNAPPGTQPLVVQTGKWRRKLSIEVEACTENPAPEDATRLPRSRSEGQLPRMAVVTGGEDRLECLLRKIGITDSEFAASGDSAPVRLFHGKGGVARFAGGDGAELEEASELWSKLETFASFDLVLLASESDQNAAAKPEATRTALHQYAIAGGRVLLQHYQSYFMSAGASELSGVATFSEQAAPADDLAVQIDDSTSRGTALAEQLLATDAQSERGKLSVDDARDGVQAVNAPAVRLAYSSSPASVQAFSLDVPSTEGAQACGRITQTDLLTGAADTSADFPNGCTSSGMSAQERALAYLIFDLGSCL